MATFPFPDPFPELIAQAARKFKAESSAYTQLRQEASSGPLKLRLQSVEIFQQYEGDVEFGWDPKCILFYNAQTDFDIQSSRFWYTRIETGGPVITIQVDFTESDSSSSNDSFARFLARVDTRIYKLPHLGTGNGNGNWSRFQAGTLHTRVVRQEGRKRLHLQFPPLRKRVYFDVTKDSAIGNAAGVLIFRDVRQLNDKDTSGRTVRANYADDRIVFSPEGDSSKVYGLFLPYRPLDLGTVPSGGVPPTTTWKDFDPDISIQTLAKEEDEEDI